MHLPLIIIISLVHYFISVDQKTQLWHRQLQDVGTVGLHYEVIRYKIPSDAQVPLEFGHVLEGLGSQQLLTRQLAFYVLLFLSIDINFKAFFINQHEHDVQVFSMSIFQSEA